MLVAFSVLTSGGSSMTKLPPPPPPPPKTRPVGAGVGVSVTINVCVDVAFFSATTLSVIDVGMVSPAPGGNSLLIFMMPEDTTPDAG